MTGLSDMTDSERVIERIVVLETGVTPSIDTRRTPGLHDKLSLHADCLGRSSRITPLQGIRVRYMIH